jgi:hypothetical protein
VDWDAYLTFLHDTADGVYQPGMRGWDSSLHLAQGSTMFVLVTTALAASGLCVPPAMSRVVHGVVAVACCVTAGLFIAGSAR